MMIKNKKTDDIYEIGAQWFQEKIDQLEPDSTPSISSARVRLQERISKKEDYMRHWINQPKFRTAWAALAVVIILAISLSIPQVRVIANSFLGLFRVEQIEAVDVGISLDSLPAEMEPYFTALDDLISDQIIMEKVVTPIEVQDIAEASQLAGFQVRMPTYPKDKARIQYQEASTIRMIIDREQWQSIIDAMGYQDFSLPKSSDGQEIVFKIPQIVVIGIGDCRYNEINEVKLGSPESENCTIFLQGDTPTIEAPPGVDINQAGQIMLQVLGMSPEEAEEFSTTVNWATTLVVPVPSDVNYRRISVEGERGILLEDQSAGGKAIYTLIWMQDSRLNALIGDGTLADALESINSLR